MYTLMLLQGNNIVDMKYPDRLVDALHIAHDSTVANNFVIIGDGIHMIGKFYKNIIKWKRQ